MASICRLILMGVLLTCAPAAFATPIVHVDTSGNAFKITNLTVGTTLYDVDFLWGTQAAVYSAGFDFTDKNDALAAVSAIVAALNVYSPVPPGVADNETLITAGTHVFGIFDVVYNLGTQYEMAWGGVNTTPTWTNQGLGSRLPKDTMIAKFTVVPEPSTALLLASGLAATALGRRRGVRSDQ